MDPCTPIHGNYHPFCIALCYQECGKGGTHIASTSIMTRTVKDLYRGNSGEVFSSVFLQENDQAMVIERDLRCYVCPPNSICFFFF